MESCGAAILIQESQRQLQPRRFSPKRHQNLRASLGRYASGKGPRLHSVSSGETFPSALSETAYVYRAFFRYKRATTITPGRAHPARNAGIRHASGISSTAQSGTGGILRYLILTKSQARLSRHAPEVLPGIGAAGRSRFGLGRLRHDSIRRVHFRARAYRDSLCARGE